jgi:hypothetical protein
MSSKALNSIEELETDDGIEVKRRGCCQKGKIGDLSNKSQALLGSSSRYVYGGKPFMCLTVVS